MSDKNLLQRINIKFRVNIGIVLLIIVSHVGSHNAHTYHYAIG
jgi:hypothetical protein